MFCYGWRPNPSYQTSPPCGQAAAAPVAEEGLFGMSWTTLALIAGGAFLLLRKKGR